MNITYRVGFKEGHYNIMAQDYPDLIPIVRYGGSFMCGELVAFASCQVNAKRLVQALNMVETFEKTWVADQ
jgi:hypothetical protein